MSTAEIIWNRVKDHPLSRVGPGLITGVADDDPSGIATYSQAGAQFGLNMLWTMPLTFPLMAAIQLMCADIGRVTGKGIAANIKAAFPSVVLLPGESSAGLIGTPGAACFIPMPRLILLFWQRRSRFTWLE